MAILPAAQNGGHEHLDLGITVGPLVLRVAVLAAISVVAGFALLRGFLAEPGRFVTAAVVATAGGAALLELLLAGGLSLPQQVVPLLLAAVAGSLYLVLSRDERFAPAVGRARRLAPLIFWPVAAIATVQLGLALFGGSGPERTLILLHTGVLVGLVALAWFAVARPRGRAVTVGLRIGAALMATALLGGVAQAMALRPADPVPGAVTCPSAALTGRDGEQRVGQDDELFQRYCDELRGRFPTQSPSAGGYRSWLAGRSEP